jgi:RNA polymerase-binding transcription factor DksA
MKEYIFNEKEYIEAIMDAKKVDLANPTNTIRNLARYNFYVNGYKKSKNYTAIVDYMTKNFKDFSEMTYQKSIDGCIKDVDKTPFKNIKSVRITKSELDKICILDDIKKQKLAFVLLCTAKYRDQYNPNNCHKTDISATDMYKMARVVLPKEQRNIYLHFLIRDGLVEPHNNSKTKNKKLLFVSEDDNDEVVLDLKEVDYKELAYVYMSWKNNGEGFTKCQRCGKTIKQSKTRPRKYCEECAEIVITEQKRLWAEKSRKNLTQQND